MAGPLPLPTTEKASTYGQEAEVKRNISAAAQYNPATKLGITRDDQPSKKTTGGVPTTAQAISSAISADPTKPVPLVGGSQVPTSTAPPLGRAREDGYGPSAGMGSMKSTQPFNSGNLQSHYAHLASLPDAGPELKWYGSQVSGG
jgi:hypothetical protein